jgi:hypothetical protein
MVRVLVRQMWDVRPNQTLHRTAAAFLVPRDTLSLSGRGR